MAFSIKTMGVNVGHYKIMRTALSLMCFFACVLLSPSALTQEPDNTSPEPSHEYLRLALKNHNELKTAIENYRSAIEQREAEVGAYDPELSEMAFSLGKALQLSHHYTEAIDAYKRSLYLNRVNHGVYSLAQAPMLRGMIESYAPLGEIKEISDRYDQLLWIHVKSYGQDDPKLIPLLSEISQWHLEAYVQTGGREDLYHLNTAFELYHVAIELSSKHEGASNLSLVGLLNNLAMTSYYLAVHHQQYPEYSDIAPSPPFGYRPFSIDGDELMRKGSYFLHGRTAQSRILDIIETNPDLTPADQALAYTGIADWYLLFGRYQYAMKTYQLAHKAVEGDNHQKEILEKLFGAPTMLPTVGTEALLFNPTTPHSLTKDAATGASKAGATVLENPAAERAKPDVLTDMVLPSALTPQSYVNLSIDITDKGKVENLQVEEVYPEDANDYKDQAKQTIRSRKFRPRFENGRPVLTNAFPIKVLIPNERS
jgi:tetratricopeptide (TPR) repeat protein